MATAVAPFVSSARARRQSTWHSAHAWMIALTMVYFSAHGNFSFLNSGGGGRSMGVLGYGILPLVFYGFVVSCLITHFRVVFAMARSNRLLTALAVLPLFSVAYSQYPVRSAYSSLFYLLGTLFAYYLVLRFPTEQIMELCVMAGVLVLFAGVLTVTLFPAYGLSHIARTEGAWEGIYIDRTSSAREMAFLLAGAIVPGAFRWRPGRLLFIALMLLFIVRAQAATAVIVFGLYGLILYALAGLRQVAPRSRTVLLIVGLPILALLLFLLVPLLADFLGLFGRDLTLTGRTVIWSSLWQSVLKRPLLGYGFAAFWNGLQGESANAQIAAHWTFGYAHNGFLEVVLQLGFVGLALFAATLIQALRNGWRVLKQDRSPGMLWCFALLILTLLYNIDEATILLPNELLSMLYVVACCALNTAARRPLHQEREVAPDVTHLSFAA